MKSEATAWTNSTVLSFYSLLKDLLHSFGRKFPIQTLFFRLDYVMLKFSHLNAAKIAMQIFFLVYLFFNNLLQHKIIRNNNDKKL